MELQLLDTGAHSASENMEIDHQLLLGLNSNSAPILHFYEWKNPSATYGYFSAPYQILNVKAIKKYQLDLAKRPTGGGIIFHSFDFAFSFLLPSSHPAFSLNTLENYRFVNNIIAKALRELLSTDRLPELLQCSIDCVKTSSDTSKFCMSKPTVYDVMIEGKKVGGAAQRKTKQGYLHQASIALTIPSLEFLEDLLSTVVIKAMQECSYPLLQNAKIPQDLHAAKTAIKSALLTHFKAKCEL